MITEERVKFQLERDAIEMGKSRLSNYSDSISFEKFCKYAHFQSEELVNFYFFKTAESNVELVKDKIVEYTDIKRDKIQNNSSISSISSIPHYMKQWALSNKENINKTHSFTLSNIAKVRNLEIHRNSTSQVDEKLQGFISREDYNQIYEALVHLKEKVIYAVERIK